MINFQHLFVVYVKVYVKDKPEHKQNTKFQNVGAGGLGGGAGLRDGGFSGLEGARGNEFERERTWLAWKGKRRRETSIGSVNEVVEFGSERRNRDTGVRFAEREQCGLHILEMAT